MRTSFWQRLVREAQRPGSVALAGLGTALLAAGVVNPLLAAASVPVYSLWGAYLVSRLFRDPDPRAEAVQEIEARLAEVAKLRYGRAHPPEQERDRDEAGETAERVRARFERLMAQLDPARAREDGSDPMDVSAREFERRLRQFRRISAGEAALLERLTRGRAGLGAPPPGELARVSNIVTWAEQISRLRADYLDTLARHPIADTAGRLEEKRRAAAAAQGVERDDLLQTVAVLQTEVARYGELQREVRTIENQLDTIESMVNNLVLSPVNAPDAGGQIDRMWDYIQAQESAGRDLRARLQQRSGSAPPAAARAAEDSSSGGAGGSVQSPEPRVQRREDR
jgi:hypothetical protein